MPKSVNWLVTKLLLGYAVLRSSASHLAPIAKQSFASRVPKQELGNQLCSE